MIESDPAKAVALALHENIMVLGQDIPQEPSGWEGMMWSMAQDESMELSVALVVTNPAAVERTIALVKKYLVAGEGEDGKREIQREIGYLFSDRVAKIKTFGDALRLLEETLIDPEEIPPSAEEIVARRERLQAEAMGLRGFVWEFKGQGAQQQHRLPAAPYTESTLCLCGCENRVVELEINVIGAVEIAPSVNLVRVSSDVEQQHLQRALELSLQEVQPSSINLSCESGDLERISEDSRSFRVFIDDRVIPFLSERASGINSTQEYHDALSLFIEAEFPGVLEAKRVELLTKTLQELRRLEDASRA